MLWFKSWLETKSRIVFALGFGLLYLFAFRSRFEDPTDVSGVLNLLGFFWVYIPIVLAGAGIRTQATFAANGNKGVYGSTQFTLSLPVTRAKLLAVRAAFGLVALVGVLAVLYTVAWYIFPALQQQGIAETAEYLLTVFVCSLAFYCLAVCISTFLDDRLILPMTSVAVIVLWSARGALPAFLDVFRPLAEASPLMTQSLPWTAMAVSVAISIVFLTLAVRISNRQEF